MPHASFCTDRCVERKAGRFNIFSSGLWVSLIFLEGKASLWPCSHKAGLFARRSLGSAASQCVWGGVCVGGEPTFLSCSWLVLWEIRQSFPLFQVSPGRCQNDDYDHFITGKVEARCSYDMRGHASNEWLAEGCSLIFLTSVELNSTPKIKTS